MNEYLGQDAVTVAVSPGRVVFLVPAGDRPSFRRAVHEASSRWAGVTEPIVPVRKGGHIDGAWCQIVELARPFKAVNAGCDSDDAARAAALLGLTLTDVSRIDRDLSTRSMHWSLVRSAVREPIVARPNAALWEIVAAGDPGEPLEGSRVAAHTWSTDDSAGRAAIGSRTSLDHSLAGFSEYWAAGGGTGPTLIWVTQPNSLSDCLWFWNLRTLRPLSFYSAPMVLLPAHAFQNWIDLDKLLHPLFERPYEGVPAVAFCSVSITSARLCTLADTLGLLRHEDVSVSYRASRSGRQLTRPLRTLNASIPATGC